MKTNDKHGTMIIFNTSPKQLKISEKVVKSKNIGMCFCVEGNMELLPFSLFVRSWRKLKDGVEEDGRSIWSIACMF